MIIPSAEVIPEIITKDGEDRSLPVLKELVIGMVDGKNNICTIAECCGIELEMACRMIGEMAEENYLTLNIDDSETERSKPAGPSSTINERVSIIRPESASLDEFGKEVEELIGKVGSANHYEILGVEPDADRVMLRSAYFALSKKFHPDTGFSKYGEEMRRKLETAFRGITQSYDALSTASQRSEYDELIADEIELWQIGKQLSSALAGDAEEPEVDPEAEPEPEPVPLKSAAPASRERAATRSARATPRRKSSSAPPSRRPTKSRSSSRNLASKEGMGSSPDMDAKRRQWARERMGKALGRSIPPPPVNAAQPQLSRTKLNALMEQSEIALQRGELVNARKVLEKVLSVDFGNERATALRAELERQENKASIQEILRKGRIQRQKGNHTIALEHFRKAIAADSGNLEARFQMADTLLENKMDLSQALRLAKEIVALGGQRARYFGTLGELLLLAKDTGRAREAFERALAIEPENRNYKKKLKACKG